MQLSPVADPARRANRQLLREAMQRRGFGNHSMECWHSTLKPEPAPAIAFELQER